MGRQPVREASSWQVGPPPSVCEAREEGFRSSLRTWSSQSGGAPWLSLPISGAAVPPGERAGLLEGAYWNPFSRRV